MYRTPSLLGMVLLIAASFLPSRTLAQDGLDVTLVSSEPGFVDIMVDGTTEDLASSISSLCFTLRCDVLADAHAEMRLAYGPLALTPYVLNFEKDGARYSTFYYIGTPRNGHGLARGTGKPVLLARIPVQGADACKAFSIGKDAYTASVNGDYYLALNGVDRTGNVRATVADGECPSLKSVPAATIREGRMGDFTVFPNPVTGSSFILRMQDAPEDLQASVSLISPLGQQLGQPQRVTSAALRAGAQLEVPPAFHGLAFVRVLIGDEIFTKPVVLTR